MEPQALISLGQTLGALQGDLRHTGQRLERIEKDLGMLKERVQRGAILALLWGLGSVLHLKAETLGEILGHMIKGMLK